MNKIIAAFVLFCALAGCGEDLGVVYYEPEDRSHFREDGTTEFTDGHEHAYDIRPIIHCRMGKDELSGALSKKYRMSGISEEIVWRAMIWQGEANSFVLIGESAPGRFFSLHEDGIYRIENYSVEPIRASVKKCLANMKVVLE